MDYTDFNTVMQRMLDNVSNEVDKREGSVIWDALAPCARELVNMAAEIEQALDNTFAGTAEREWLIKRCNEVGVTPYPATYAVRRALFTPDTVAIDIGQRFSFENVNFKVIENVGGGEYYLQCEEAGEIGNDGSGILVPISYVKGLETATLLPEVVIFGEEEESTEDLRQRYFDTLPSMTLDGNIAQYSKWCRGYAGIGNFKIFPEWNGKNTVKVSILSSENTVASELLIKDFQEYLDPNSEGLGMGKAPIGAVVTVSTASETIIDVHALLAFKEGFSGPVDAEKELRDYIQSQNYNKSVISYIGVCAILQNNYAVDVALDITINGIKENIQLGNEEIARLGSFTYEVAE